MKFIIIALVEAIPVGEGIREVNDEWYKMAVEDTAMMLVTELNLHSSLARYNEGALHFNSVTTNYLIRNNNHGGGVSTFRRAARCFYGAFLSQEKNAGKKYSKVPLLYKLWSVHHRVV
jgi:hypothetical protein